MPAPDRGGWGGLVMQGVVLMLAVAGVALAFPSTTQDKIVVATAILALTMAWSVGFAMGVIHRSRD